MGKEANPIPQGKYVPAVRFGDLVFTAGMTPRNNGVLIKEGKVLCADAIEDYRDRICFFSHCLFLPVYCFLYRSMTANSRFMAAAAFSLSCEKLMRN